MTEYCSGLATITMPNSLTNFGTSVFRGCASLTSVTTPNSVTNIANFALYGCTGLTGVCLPPVPVHDASVTQYRTQTCCHASHGYGWREGGGEGGESENGVNSPWTKTSSRRTIKLSDKMSS
ncbi:MAG TPA: leucine-rich repeat protein [Candidatus Acidoferrum sp.]|nr:leucine-rich repeat protein [Candidatus Acidoferrum sp.]